LSEASTDARLRARAAILDHLPADAILDRYEGAGGSEILSGKFASPESSAALAANAFGLFLDRPGLLSLPIPVSGAAQSVVLEAEMRFPWSGGRHPWLDAAVVTDDALIGIESKRFEPFRDKKIVALSEAYWRPVWGEKMGPFERMRDGLASGARRYAYLDAPQLVKHAFGLCTQARKLGRHAGLLYLYAEPTAYPDGRSIPSAAMLEHRRELEDFAEAVADPDCAVSFCSLSYATLLKSWMVSQNDALVLHATAMLRRFNV
jgi:hypothetical protein